MLKNDRIKKLSKNLITILLFIVYYMAAYPWVGQFVPYLEIEQASFMSLAVHFIYFSALFLFSELTTFILLKPSTSVRRKESTPPKEKKKANTQQSEVIVVPQKKLVDKSEKTKK